MAVSPVLAIVVKSGTKNCSINQIPFSQSLSTGFTEHYPPGSKYAAWNNFANWLVRTKVSNPGTHGGFWWVEVTGGSLNDPGTFASCLNGTQ